MHEIIKMSLVRMCRFRIFFYLELDRRHVVLFPIWLNTMDLQNIADVPKCSLILQWLVFLVSLWVTIMIRTNLFKCKNWTEKKEMHNQLVVRDAIIFTCSQISDRRWYNLCWCYCWSSRLYRLRIWWWWINCVTAFTFGKFTAIHQINVLNHEQIAKRIQCQLIETNSHDYDVKRLYETARQIYIFRFECLFLRFNH